MDNPFEVEERAFPDAENGITAQAIARSKRMAESGIGWEVASTEGDKRNKQWFTDTRGTEPTDEQWSEVFEAYKKAGPSDKKKILKDFDIGLQTLQKKAGYEPTPRGGASAPSVTKAASRARSKEDVESGLEERIDALEDELKKSKARLERLKAMDDDEYEEMKQLMFG